MLVIERSMQTRRSLKDKKNFKHSSREGEIILPDWIQIQQRGSPPKASLGVSTGRGVLIDQPKVSCQFSRERFYHILGTSTVEVNNLEVAVYFLNEFILIQRDSRSSASSLIFDILLAQIVSFLHFPNRKFWLDKIIALLCEYKYSTAPSLIRHLILQSRAIGTLA